MMNSLKGLIGHHIHASNGFVGTLDDFYFDDSQWVMRYLIVDVARFLFSRRVLISPVAIEGIDWANNVVSLKHTIEQIKDSPNIDVDQPVHRQLEEQLYRYYQWVTHWTPHSGLPEPETQAVPSGDTHLRSMNNVRQYDVMAFDGRVGAIDDFIVNDDGWRLPLVVLDTHHYLDVDQVVIPTLKIKGIRVEDREVSVDMTKAEVDKAPRSYTAMAA